ncbi:Uncharacterised protein [Salmonella enterica subsp. enterica serovar Typhi]|nr:Uncharacterised protein [Salmonella enterica subsp. enterica serovar Typhi]
MNEPINPDVRINKRADVYAVADGLLRHANKPGSAVEHNRFVNIFIIHHHLALTIHELPCCATLPGYVIHKMPRHAKEYPPPGEYSSRHFRRQAFGRTFGFEVFHQRTVHISDRVTGSQRL